MKGEKKKKRDRKKCNTHVIASNTDCSSFSCTHKDSSNFALKSSKESSHSKRLAELFKYKHTADAVPR